MKVTEGNIGNLLENTGMDRGVRPPTKHRKQRQKQANKITPD